MNHVQRDAQGCVGIEEGARVRTASPLRVSTRRAAMASPERSKPQVEEVFNDRTWQAQAERPGVLDQLGPKWQEFLSTKGQGLKTYLEDVQLAYKMLRDPQFQMANDTKTVLIIALLYIISPIDLMPDAIPFLGLLDDVLVAGYALRQAAAELERYRHHLQTTQGAAVRQ